MKSIKLTIILILFKKIQFNLCVYSMLIMYFLCIYDCFFQLDEIKVFLTTDIQFRLDKLDEFISGQISFSKIAKLKSYGSCPL